MGETTKFYPGNKGPNGAPFDLQPLRMKMPDENTIAYAAGFFDGEGYISVQKINGGRRIRTMIAIGNTNEEVLIHLREKFGIGTIRHWVMSKKAHIKTQKQMFIWRVCGARDVVAILRAMRPFLIVKATTADEAIHFLIQRYGGRV